MAKFGFEISGKPQQELERLANDLGITRAEVIRRALGVYSYLHREARDETGIARVEIAEHNDKPRRTVILP
jgi:hypothetical protein